MDHGSLCRMLLCLMCGLATASAQTGFRPPAVPLVTHDPYFSIWSAADRLTDEPTKHWTGADHSLVALLRVDGRTFRVAGTAPGGQFAPLPQTGLEVWPTRTIYRFAGQGIALTLTFLTPALPADLDTLSRPASYIVWTVNSTDGRQHDVSLYLDASKELAVNIPQQRVVWGRFRLGDVTVLRMGSQEQPVLGKSGDDLRIDWGYLYLAAPPTSGAAQAATDRRAAVHSFEQSGRVPDADELEADEGTEERRLVLAYSAGLGKVGAAPVSRHVVLAYDDMFSVEFLHRQLRPYWRRNGTGAGDMLLTALREYDTLAARCARFDEELMADLRSAGGEEYARLCALAYRQTLAAHKLVAGIDGAPLMFSKENFSNGCIGTVDVICPSAPFFLLFNPKLLEAQLRPLFEYASLPRWKFPFAPHDLGTYPLANGQVYGGREKSEDRQMPVEESGNMLLLMAAISHSGGGTALAESYWPLLSMWAAYLKQKGLDPENQLSTDDFMGHLAHNANLSLKAILALGAYGKLCERSGRTEEAKAYRSTASEFARSWVQLADDGDHFRLAFDAPGTWSQKYNLVWDRALDLNLFPAEIARKEIAFYKGKLDKYGLPLDNRKPLTKLDWLVWTATLTESAADFETFLRPAYQFVNETPNRVPLADGHWTGDARQRNKAQARSVVGGVFMKMLATPALREKWQKRASAAPQGFADDFSHGIADWWVEGGERTWVQNGRLQMKADPATGAAGNVATVWRRGALPADFELELDAQVVSSVPNVNNINLFLNYTDPSGVPLEKSAESRQSAAYGLYHQINGYIITFLNDTETNSGKARVRIRRNPGFQLLAEAFTYHCRAGITYHLKVVKKGGDIRFSVDGQELLRANDPHPLGSGYFGLRTFQTWLWWDNIRLKPLV